MSVWVQLQWALAIWCTLEGLIVTCLPGVSRKINRLIFRRFSNELSQYSTEDLRKMGIIELIFGLALGSFLFWLGRQSGS